MADEPAAGIATVGSAEPSMTVWPPEAIQGFHERWQEVQLHFVDDPQAAAEQAASLVGEVLDRFTATLTSRKHELDSELDRWRGTDGSDPEGSGQGDGAQTERMRMAVRGYRGLLDQLLEG